MRFSAFILILLLYLLVGTASAQGEVTADDVNAIAKQLFCPVCENEPLDQCGTKACQDWRAEIRLQLEQGATEQEIKDNFQRRYGDRVLAEPPREGINWILWLLPVALVLFGGIWFARYLRQLQAGKSDPAPVVSSASGNPTAPPPQDDYVARIEDELRDNE
ncbi:MAG: cytochrome c-type biogenesis protein CcmH [Anaerolineae bacterium]|nr:cytochrome c-type biogenesis protein CcmH [Anaerolineae bacterium]MCO5190514.1 cytochrome c-type biogenesis protein CcmH [Anaerolineae bacterium]MCO5193389.1 cytochrome c-type biogenesis protein CcmH [Anaerolineae bacterium]MCO5198785.1 cytochrome c-type biogenesis protein CcmH [Anaerolineae bacterium]MCO5207895.1 cytochrome c-type biogenesis protein CcmH [Anaerolineae bacterium]